MPDRRTRKYLRRIAEKLDPENAKSSVKKYYLTRNKGNETLTTSE